MGSAEGSLRTAATRLGLSTSEYLAKVDAGLLHCYRCQVWHPADDFAVDRSRARGRAGSCRTSTSAFARSNYSPTARPEPGRRYVAARDDDRKQARRRVNYLVEAGLVPAPNALPCTDCGHAWVPSGPRHEYDHHQGYAPEHHEDVEAVCSPCHHAREEVRRAA